ncbi:MAG: glycosyltransferase family 2 protein [Candidatus Omnitrophica bacterium]|nr:glycosyltransferase family 2 protein [Candidatus Omnitrophota bacterium]
MIYIIIPVHNRKKYTYDCLLSLKKQALKDFKTVVVDDGSTDGTGEMIKREFPETILLHGDGNLWWTKATNLGVKYALDHNADYIMTLNDDTIAGNDFIEKMLFWAKREPLALLGAFALDVNTKRPVYGGEIIDWKRAGSTDLLDILKPEEQRGLHKITHFSGRGLLIPVKVFRKIGLFDARHFPQTIADYDFTHRAVKAGYKIFCNYDAKLFFYPGASGDVQLRRDKNLKNYFNHLFGIKGGGNLKRFVLYAFRNCPKRYLASFLIIGLLRRIGGYLADWFVESIKGSEK